MAEEESARASGKPLPVSEEKDVEGLENEERAEETKLDEEKSKNFAVPAQVNLSPEEARILFKVGWVCLHVSFNVLPSH